MTYVLGPCPVKGCSKKHGVTVVRRSRSALTSEAAGAATGATSELTEAVGLTTVPAAVARTASVGSHQPSTPTPGHLRGPREPFTGPFVSPLRIPAESLSVLPPTHGDSAGVPSGTPRQGSGL